MPMIVEVWQTEDGTQISVFPTTASERDREVGLSPPEQIWVKLREIEGETWEDCMKKHNELMGWEPYES
jgi:hypothetical protein